jgi:hypothetical protein
VNRRHALPVLFAALVLATATAGGSCRGNLSPSEVRGQRAQLSVARGRWSARGPVDYRYRFQYLCFCAGSHLTPVEIQVRGGRVVAVLEPATGRPAPVAPGRPSPTVEDLFAVVQSALDRDVDWIDVQYDPVLGYPAVIRIDADTRAVDEEQSYFAGNLTRMD